MENDETTNNYEVTNYFTYEPSRVNRFVINTVGTDIPNFLFRKYKLYNDGEDLHLDIEFMEILNYVFNPKEFFNLTNINIDTLDPTGVVVSTTSYQILKSNFEKYGDYNDDSLSMVKLNLVAKVTQHTNKFPNITKE